MKTDKIEGVLTKNGFKKDANSRKNFMSFVKDNYMFLLYVKEDIITCLKDNKQIFHNDGENLTSIETFLKEIDLKEVEVK